MITYRSQGLGFFERTWKIFRFCMKSIFTVFSVVYVFCLMLIFFCSPDMGNLPPHQFLVSIASALLFGLVFISYATLFLAVPISAFCAGLALVATALIRVSEMLFPRQKSTAFGWDDCGSYPPAPDPRIEVIESRVDAAAASCPVCAASLGEEHVSCRRCDSPHHSECWEYIGCCSTFGCGSTAHNLSAQGAVTEKGSDWCGFLSSRPGPPAAN